MVARDLDSKAPQNHPVVVISSIAATICVVAVVMLFISRLFDAITSCCKNLFRKKGDHPYRSNTRTKTFLGTPKTTRYEQLRPGMKRPLSIENMESYKTAIFQIPGMINANTIQPIDSSSGYSTASFPESSDSLSTDGSSRAFIDEMVQPNENELYPLSGMRRKNASKNVALRKLRTDSLISKDGEVNLDEFKLELYDAGLRRTQMTGSLGKIKFTLQYEDKTKRKLIMTLHELLDLQFVRGTEQVVGVYLSAILIPERDYRFQTKQLPCETNIKLDEIFTYHSRPHNRDFEARTLHITITYVEKSGKEIVYGESRMPLLSNEIYSQVGTSIRIGIKPSPPNVEIGDAQIVLSYSSQEKKLTVMIKTVKICTHRLLDNLTGLHIKAHLVRIGGDRLGKKRSVSKSLGNTTSTFVEFTEHMTFELEQENFLLCTLKLNIHGRHKIMGKHLSLGKIRIGDSNRDEGGKVHWKTVLNSEGIGWNMWHPIYNA